MDPNLNVERPSNYKIPVYFRTVSDIVRECVPQSPVCMFPHSLLVKWLGVTGCSTTTWRVEFSDEHVYHIREYCAYPRTTTLEAGKHGACIRLGPTTKKLPAVWSYFEPVGDKLVRESHVDKKDIPIDVFVQRWVKKQEGEKQRYHVLYEYMGQYVGDPQVQRVSQDCDTAAALGLYALDYNLRMIQAGEPLAGLLVKLGFLNSVSDGAFLTTEQFKDFFMKPNSKGHQLCFYWHV